MPMTIEKKLEKIKQQKRALLIAERALQSKIADEERRRRTRAKIIVGGLVLAGCKYDPMLAEVVRRLAAKLTGEELGLVRGIYPFLAALPMDSAQAHAHEIPSPDEGN